jgi:hypothetical protein
MWNTRDPALMVVLPEDGAACFGVVMAGGGIALTTASGMPIFDVLAEVGISGLNLDNRNFESVTDFHSVCYVYGRLGGRNRLFRAKVR